MSDRLPGRSAPKVSISKHSMVDGITLVLSVTTAIMAYLNASHSPTFRLSDCYTWAELLVFAICACKYAHTYVMMQAETVPLWLYRYRLATATILLSKIQTSRYETAMASFPYYARRHAAYRSFVSDLAAMFDFGLRIRCNTCKHPPRYRNCNIYDYRHCSKNDLRLSLPIVSSQIPAEPSKQRLFRYFHYHSGYDDLSDGDHIWCNIRILVA